MCIVYDRRVVRDFIVITSFTNNIKHKMCFIMHCLLFETPLASRVIPCGILCTPRMYPSAVWTSYSWHGYPLLVINWLCGQ